MAARMLRRACRGCGRTEERGARGWRLIRLLRGRCAACRDAAGEAAADDRAARAARRRGL
jgi:hypothetical protein